MSCFVLTQAFAYMTNSVSVVDTNPVSSETVTNESNPSNVQIHEESSGNYINVNQYLDNTNSEINHEDSNTPEINTEKTNIPEESALSVFKNQPKVQKKYYKQKKIYRKKASRHVNNAKSSESKVKIQEQAVKKENNINNKPDKLVLMDYPYEEKPLNMPKEVKSKEPNFISVLFSLVFVLSLIMAIAWFYARLKGIAPGIAFSGKSYDDINKFNILTTTALGQGKSIHLVEIKGKQLVIASTASNINLLTEFNQGNTSEKLLEEDLKPFHQKQDEKEESIFLDTRFYSFQYSDVYEDYIREEAGINN